MITIVTTRHWLICTAVTVNDLREPTTAVGLTQSSARRRLHRILDRGVFGR